MIDLVVPGLDTVAVPESAEDGRERFRALLQRWFPDLDAARIDLLSEGITAFRARLAAGGWIYHGIAGGPAGSPAEGALDVPTSWHYLAAVGPAPTDVAPGTLLARLLGWTRLPDVEPTPFASAMGHGLGFHADVRTDGVLRGVALDTTSSVGLAAHVSIDVERGRCLLVVGLSLLPGSTAAMATLAEQMALRSTFAPDGQSDPSSSADVAPDSSRSSHESS